MSAQPPPYEPETRPRPLSGTGLQHLQSSKDSAIDTTPTSGLLTQQQAFNETASWRRTATRNLQRRLEDGEFPCVFSRNAFKKGLVYIVFVEGTAHDDLTRLANALTEYIVLSSFNGDFSHAIRKAPLLRQDTAGEPTQSVRSARIPSPEEIDLAANALSAAKAHLGLDDPLLYARVDLVHTSTGDPAVLELELCEPSLSLAFHPSSAHTFAAAMATRIGLSRTATHR